MDWLKGKRTYIAAAVTAAIEAVITTAEVSGGIDKPTADTARQVVLMVGGFLTAMFLRAAIK
jgi:hypothetical protein